MKYIRTFIQWMNQLYEYAYDMFEDKIKFNSVNGPEQKFYSIHS